MWKHLKKNQTTVPHFSVNSSPGYVALIVAIYYFLLILSFDLT